MVKLEKDLVIQRVTVTKVGPRVFVNTDGLGQIEALGLLDLAKSALINRPPTVIPPKKEGKSD